MNQGQMCSRGKERNEGQALKSPGSTQPGGSWQQPYLLSNAGPRVKDPGHEGTLECPQDHASHFNHPQPAISSRAPEGPHGRAGPREILQTAAWGQTVLRPWSGCHSSSFPPLLGEPRQIPSRVWALVSFPEIKNDNPWGHDGNGQQAFRSCLCLLSSAHSTPGPCPSGQTPPGGPEETPGPTQSTDCPPQTPHRREHCLKPGRACHSLDRAGGQTSEGGPLTICPIQAPLALSPALEGQWGRAGWRPTLAEHVQGTRHSRL